LTGSGIRQAAAGSIEALPRIGALPSEPMRDCLYRELRGIELTVDLVP
jgi:hypothetical protein